MIEKLIERKTKEKLNKKRSEIIKRLIELEIFPKELSDFNTEQKMYYDQIREYDFTYWEKIKELNNWGNKEKLTESERILRDKKGRVRSYLRENNVLPTYGEPLTEEQQKIINDIEIGDFTFFEKFKEEKMTKLREAQLNNYTDDRKTVSTPTRRTELPGYAANSLPKFVFHRLRMCQILPSLYEPLNETQQMIVDDVNENWLGKSKRFFLNKYIEHSTPEGRLLYRLYTSHLKEGFNFNITIEDIVIPEYCPILDIKLSTDPKDYKEQFYYTGDRIDSAKGLVKGNIQVISMLANRMKNKATEEQLLLFATNGLKILNNVR